MGRTEAKRAVSRSTLGGIQRVTHNETGSCKRLKIKNRLNVGHSGTVAQLNLRIDTLGLVLKVGSLFKGRKARNLSIDCAQLISHSSHGFWAGEAEEKSRGECFAWTHDLAYA